MKRIYLDNNATTALDPQVFTLLSHTLQHSFGNPSSIHSFGQEAKALLVKARQTLADICSVRSQEILFTSTATEALNLLIRGFFGSRPSGHMITSKGEHAAVFRTVEHMQAQGVDVTFLDIGAYGAPTPESLQQAIRPETRLICLMAANNETGVCSDIEAYADIAARFQIPLIVDGVALFGKKALSPHPGISAIAFSGHKFHGPKGVAFAVIRKGLKLCPCIIGGEQEYGLRAGTENLPAIVAMAEAAIIAQRSLEQSCLHMQTLRDYFEERVKALLPTISINGQGPRVANTSNICFEGCDGEALLMYLDLHGVAASLGSACSSGAIEPSRVLLEMGLTRRQALSSLRFSLSRFTTKEEIDRTVALLSKFQVL
jgi:cysteine desulfurase